jgi:hypothetical protein
MGFLCVVSVVRIRRILFRRHGKRDQDAEEQAVFARAS